MKPQARPQSKIPTTGINTNQKRKISPEDGEGSGESSLLKKNEFTLIIAGALVVTVLVFFLFFWDSAKVPEKKVVAKGTVNGEQVETVLEKRVAELEVSLARLASSPGSGDGQGGEMGAKGLTALEQRLERLETGLTLKVDALMERLNKMERQMETMKSANEKPAPVIARNEPAEKAPAVKAPAVKAPAEKKPAVAEKPVSEKSEKKDSLFHTVQKGETLWSISQKYKTSVAAIRKLNNLSPEDQIYPGSNILVK